ncbi:hypothetical protein SDC9_193159 [bioreactor metagenome]|uniref:Holliday junction resolvase n=1 Tax=bioreactor metagenome TaxID=1076179 RepID=A0A645I4A0_9ZZZZ
MNNYKQRERRDRGEEFQEEIRRSWRLIPNCWRMRIADGRGGTRPADEIILTMNGNFLAEHKRTSGARLSFDFLRSNQAKGLIDFDNALPQNYGLIFISFHNRVLDEAYAIRLVSAMEYMHSYRKYYIPLRDIQQGIRINAIQLPRIVTNDELAYDLQELVRCCKLL